MNKRERILERRKIFKQEFLRPLAALMYYEIKVKAWKAKEKRPINQTENLLLEKLTLASESFHDFLQSHEYNHLPRVSRLLEDKLKGIRAAIRGLREFYELNREKPELFDALPKAVIRMREEIEKFKEFEKRNQAHRSGNGFETRQFNAH